MPKFKVGDVCIGQNLIRDLHHNGMECMVTHPFGLYECSDERIRGVFECYLVKWADGTWGGAYESKLRLKRPPAPEALGEWELCPWRPARVTESETV